MGLFGLILVLCGLIGVSLAEECHRSGDCHITTCTHGGELKCNNRTCVCVPHPCASHPCQNHGVCEEQHGIYLCKCPHGFSGTNCEATNICAQQPHVCNDHGSCQPTDQSPFYKCGCLAGYSGSNCSIQSLSTPHTTHLPTTTRAHASHATTAVPHPCASHPCKNHGNCEEQHGKYLCKCQGGFHGTNCEANPCDSSPCLNGGTCTASAQSPFYHCKCRPGYRQHNCSEHPCDHAYTCQHGGTCEPTLQYPFYHCNCSLGHTGQHCQDNACKAQPCHNGGTCHVTNKDPYYFCECAHGHSNRNCLYDPCHSRPCFNGATCTATTTSPFYQCQCAPGFHYEQCQFLIETPTSSTHAPQNTTTQKPTYITTLASTNGSMLVSTNGLTLMPTTFTTTDVPAHSTTLTLTNGPASSTTKSHISVNTTIGTNHCDSSPCLNGGTCTASAQLPFYHCICRPGYDHQNCSVHPCNRDHVCLHGGTCEPISQFPFYHCNCSHGHTGQHCEDRVKTTTSSNHAPSNTTTHQPTNITTLAPSSGPTLVSTNGPALVSTNGPTLMSTTFTTTDVPTHAPTNVPASSTTQSHVSVNKTMGNSKFCLACDDAVSPHTCDKITICGSHEICYVDSYVTSVGSIRFNLGCRDVQQCGVTDSGIGKRSKEELQLPLNVMASDEGNILCTQCCNGSLCNAGGCVSDAFAPISPDVRGPVCFNCEQQANIDDCYKIRICGRDEMCQIEANLTSAAGHQAFWRTRCVHEPTCRSAQVIQSQLMAHGKPCTMACCKEDLCNQSCPGSS
ncbi:neurogenic locus notch homolog protein 1-like isoform X9 [Dreissena polymorpha]|uniref:neurogenic locus notch homolog protein 1-like isoform X4 n=1 Tax=Dreissena polymorpha TaxID=45954 RepID=UPI0022653931|nr:neurogenic locus notch homolog protein 1-like isoform X4 [Dreissena polymorpha]XP_052264304.1 neurogenic locus notch homolog protein 1-like isoform X5 [Dreissena polymorpha]XP_052264305.1 neurogenic locus notch homolog protein 1-like isoform X6 [Dreissena polymorpha]XP_052264308.1 neurogenic locus notch homolog protein 1-like isoform X9 [Dreissena polymorpha]